MNEGSLYKGRKITGWTIKRVAEVLSSEWELLGPDLKPDAMTAYSHKSTQISFEGAVKVTLGFVRDKYPPSDSVGIADTLSFNPNPSDLSMHVLNTLNLGMFLGLFPELTDKKLFIIKKEEPWEGSVMQIIARRGMPLIETMLKFESCFHLLLDDEYEIDGVRLDSKSLSLTHHLNQVKAYRLAEIYGHPEKLDEAIEAIKKFAEIDELSRQRLDKLCSTKSAGGMDWLYTQEMIERLCK